ncbi:Chromatin assembly complex, subunit 3 [Homalodisca vitripennis]|nr:Chromatin assembly complex, subunit 3 [Homalodisca vitripennis]
MVTRTKKIFVGGLSAPTTLEDVKNYFEQFGSAGCNRKLLHPYATLRLVSPPPRPSQSAFHSGRLWTSLRISNEV